MANRFGIPEDGKCPAGKRNSMDYFRTSELAAAQLEEEKARRIARAIGMSNHPAGKAKGRCFCGRPIKRPGEVFCAEHD